MRHENSQTDVIRYSNVMYKFKKAQQEAQLEEERAQLEAENEAPK